MGNGDVVSNFSPLSFPIPSSPFPVLLMSCENCVNRREFLARSAAVAVVTALAVDCGDGQIGAPSGQVVPAGGAVQIKVSNFPELATVGKAVRVGDRRAAMRTGASSFIGLSMICTHQQCTTDVSPKLNQFVCPCHRSRFAADGKVIEGPATQNLASLNASYNAQTDILTLG